MKLVKRAAILLAALVVAFGVGWLMGASGRGAAEDARDRAELRLALTETRAQILGARVSLYNMNFGDASATLEAAKAGLERAREALMAGERADQAGRVDRALDHVRQAQVQAGKLDPSAHASAGQAVQVIDEILGTLGSAS